MWSTFNESGFLSRVICRGSNVEGKKSRVTNKKSRVFAKSGFYLIKVSGLLFPKANFLFLVAAKLKRLSLSKHTVIEIHTYRIHTYQQIGEVLQIRNPLRFLTDCSVSPQVSPTSGSIDKKYFFPCLLRFWYPPRISVFLRTPRGSVFLFLPILNVPPRISSKPPSLAKLP